MINEVLNNFRVFKSIYLKDFPNSKIEFKKSFSVNSLTYLKAWFGIIYLIFYKFKNKRKYIFNEYRYAEIMDLFKPDEVLVISGNKNKNKNYGYLWNGGLLASILLAFDKGISLPLKIQSFILINKFNYSNFLFFYEDSLPIANFFAVLGKKILSPTIIIQHGFSRKKEIYHDGMFCKYNFLYSNLQKQVILDCKSELKIDSKYQSTYLELGLPFDVKAPKVKSNEIILVGTGWKGINPSYYLDTLKFYDLIRKQFIGSKWKVYYRPHPNENVNDYLDYDFDVDPRSNKICLSKTKKIFIGYVSSILYESKVLGHGVINILNPISGELAFDTDFKVTKLNPVEVYNAVQFVDNIIRNRKSNVYLPLKERFFNVFEKLKNIEKI